MSTKLLHSKDAEEAQSIVWRMTPGGTSASAGPPNKSAPDPGDQVRLIVDQQSRIHQLERQVEERSKQAYQQGHAAGETAGAQQAAARLEPVMARLARTIEELTLLRKRFRTEAEEDAVRLAVAVARRIINRELTVDPDSLLGVVKAAFDRVDAREIHRIRLHPEDKPVLERQLQQLGLPPRTELVADPALERGGVVFETSRGNLDASVSTQMREIESGFVDIVRRGS